MDTKPGRLGGTQELVKMGTLKIECVKNDKDSVNRLKLLNAFLGSQSQPSCTGNNWSSLVSRRNYENATR